MFVSEIGPPGEVRGRRPPGARRLDQLLHRAGELEQAQPRRALDRRDQQPAGRVGRDAEVDVAVHHDVRPVRRVDPRRVDHRVAHGRPDEAGGHEDHRRDAQARRARQGAQPRQDRHRPAHVDVDPLGDVRRGERRLHHGVRHRPVHAADREPLAGHGAGAGRRRGAAGAAAGHRCRALRRPAPITSARVTSPCAPVGVTVARSTPEVAGELAHRRLRAHRAGRDGTAERRLLRREVASLPTTRLGRALAHAVAHEHRLTFRRRRSIRRLHRDDRRAHRHDRALGDEQLGHGAREGARQLHGRLRGLDLDDQLVDLDDVAGPHVPPQDLGLGQSLARRPAGRRRAPRSSRHSLSRPSTRSTASSTRSRSGRKCSSSRLAG